MALRIRNENWKDDEELKRDLEKYVKQNLKRKEVLDFVSSKYPMYVWSLRTLCCRLSHFNVKCTSYEIELDNLRQAVAEEMQGPGKLLGYCKAYTGYCLDTLMYRRTWSMLRWLKWTREVWRKEEALASADKHLNIFYVQGI